MSAPCPFCGRTEVYRGSDGRDYCDHCSTDLLIPFTREPGHVCSSVPYNVLPGMIPMVTHWVCRCGRVTLD
jgi:hypothetical protein